MKFLGCILISVLLGGCSTAHQELNTKDTFYKRAMSFKVNGLQYLGTAVLGKANVYNIEAINGDDIDFFGVRTCHRDYSAEDQGDKSKYTYIPKEGIEDKYCPIELTVFNKKGKHSFAFLIISEPLKTLRSTLTCNGLTTSNYGSSVCQAASGLIQSIEFDNDVIMSDSGDYNCKLENVKTGKRFEFKVKKGRCVYTFMEQSSENKMHRMSTLGYEDVILREN